MQAIQQPTKQEHEQSLSVCQICNEPSHGTHFGVLSCRACAAFFRRSIVLKRTYDCKKNASCVKNERIQCKYCRFQKCVRVGMTAENVKYNYDNVTTVAIRKLKKHQLEKNIKDVTVNTVNDKYGGTMVKLDISGLLFNVQNILEEYDPPKNLEKLTALQKMEVGLKNYRDVHHSSVIKFVGEVNMKDILGNSNVQLKEIARFLSHSEHFRQLPVDDRLKMLKCVWVQWKRLERFDSTAQMFGRKMYEKNIVKIQPGVFAYANELNVNCESILRNQDCNVKGCMNNFSSKMMELVGKPLTELELTSIEVAFMLTHLSWHVAGKELQGKVLEASERALEEVANDLHNYYIHEMRLQNYALRLVKMMNVVLNLQKTHRERQKIIELYRIFDVFRVEVSDPDVYKSYF